MSPEFSNKIIIEADAASHTVSFTDGESLAEKALSARDWEVFISLAEGGTEGTSWQDIEATAMKHDRWADYPGNNAIKRLRKIFALSDPEAPIITRIGGGLGSRYVLNGSVFINDETGEFDFEESDQVSSEEIPSHPLELSNLEFAVVSLLLRNNYGETFTFGRNRFQFLPPYDMLEIGSNLIDDFHRQNPDFAMENGEYVELRANTIRKLFETTSSEDMDDLIDVQYSKSIDNGELLLWLCLEGAEFLQILASKYVPELMPDINVEPEVESKPVPRVKKPKVKSIVSRHPSIEDIIRNYLDKLEALNLDKPLTLFQLPKLIDNNLTLETVAGYEEKRYVKPEHRRRDKHPEFGAVDIVAMQYLVDYGKNSPLSPRQVGELRSIIRRHVKERTKLPDTSRIMHLP